MVANNGAEQQYDFTDNAVPERMAYYRIIGVDVDGTEYSSAVKTVVWPTSEQVVTLYPNPTDRTGLRVKWQAKTNRQYQYYVYNSYGQEVSRQQLGGASAGADAGAGPEQLVAMEVTVPTTDLPAGVYLLRLRAQDWEWAGHFVVK
ncbi:MAG: T9SS type A sorting domain-containing protein [Bacteroidota bacterium]